jgi:phosphoribosylanthranilate isomerase
VRPGTTTAQLRARMDAYAPVVDFFLLDTHRAGQRGGTGQAFDWAQARTLSDDYRIFVAGGIDAANVAAAVALLHPYGVDLASSVEAAPGVKDFDKLAAFFEAFAVLP